MFGPHQDLGAALFSSWSEEQRREEIGKLVAGYRAGVPLGVLCKMAETIAGSREQAREYLAQFLSAEERRQAIAGEHGGMRLAAEEFLL